jgi:hypothetical protein
MFDRAGSCGNPGVKRRSSVQLRWANSRPGGWVVALLLRAEAATFGLFSVPCYQPRS